MLKEVNNSDIPSGGDTVPNVRKLVLVNVKRFFL